MERLQASEAALEGVFETFRVHEEEVEEQQQMPADRLVHHTFPVWGLTQVDDPEGTNLTSLPSLRDREVLGA